MRPAAPDASLLSLADREAANTWAGHLGKDPPYPAAQTGEQSSATADANRTTSMSGGGDESMFDPLRSFYITDARTRRRLLGAYMAMGVSHRILVMTAIFATVVEDSVGMACVVAGCAFLPSLFARHVWRSLMRQREPHLALRYASYWGLVGTTIAMVPYAATRAFGSAIVALFSADGLLTASFVSDSRGHTSMAAAPRYRTLFALARSVNLVPKALAVIACVVTIRHPPAAVIFAMLAWVCELIAHFVAYILERHTMQIRAAELAAKRGHAQDRPRNHDERGIEMVNTRGLYAVSGNDDDELPDDFEESSGEEDDGDGEDDADGNASGQRVPKHGATEDTDELLPDQPDSSGGRATETAAADGFSFVQARDLTRTQGVRALRVPRAQTPARGAPAAGVESTETVERAAFTMIAPYRETIDVVVSSMGNGAAHDYANERAHDYRAFAVASFCSGFTSGAMDSSRAALALVLAPTDVYTIMLGAMIAYLSAIIASLLIIRFATPYKMGIALSVFVVFIYSASVLDVMTGGRDPSLLTLTHVVVAVASEGFSAFADWESVRWCALPENRTQYVADLFVYTTSAHALGTFCGVVLALVFAAHSDYNVFTLVALMGIVAMLSHRRVEWAFRDLVDESEDHIDKATAVVTNARVTIRQVYHRSDDGKMHPSHRSAGVEVPRRGGARGRK